jgi:hypothetical protein
MVSKKQKIGAIVVVILIVITIFGLAINYEINGRLSYSAGDYITYKGTNPWEPRNYTEKYEILEMEKNSSGENLHIGISGDHAIIYINYSRTGTYFDVNPLNYPGNFHIAGIELIHLKWGDRIAVHYQWTRSEAQEDLWTVQGLLVKMVQIYQTYSGPYTLTMDVFDSNIRALTG